MTTKNKPSLFNGCVGGVFKFFFDVDSNRLYLNEDMSPEFVFLMDSLLKDEYEVVYLKSIENCPVCGSELNKNGTDEFLLNKNREIKKQKYVCKDKNCRKHSKVCLKKFIDKYCNYTQDIREFRLNSGCIDYCSHDKKSELIEMMTGVKLPKSTVHYHEKTLAEEYLDKKEKNDQND